MSQRLYIVTGMHRSGTSLAARMLQVFGIALPGELVGPAPDNEKGFFEDREFLALNEDLFAALGLRWDSLDGFFLSPTDFSGRRFTALKKRAAALLEARFADHDQWAFKDPRVARLGGFWQPLLARRKVDCRYVIPVRNPTEVAGSLGRRNGFADLKSQYLWFLYTLDALQATAGQPRLLLAHQTLLSSPEALLASVRSFFLGRRRLDADAAAEFCTAFVEPRMQHNADYEPDSALSFATELFALLQAEVDEDGTETDALAPAVDELRRRFSASPELSGLLKFASTTESSLREAYRTLEDEYRTRQEDFHAEEARLIEAAAALRKSLETSRQEAELREAEFLREKSDLFSSTAKQRDELEALQNEYRQAQEAFHAEEQRLTQQAEASRSALSTREQGFHREEQRLTELLNGLRERYERLQEQFRAQRESFHSEEERLAERARASRQAHAALQDEFHERQLAFRGEEHRLTEQVLQLNGALSKLQAEAERESARLTGELTAARTELTDLRALREQEIAKAEATHQQLADRAQSLEAELGALQSRHEEAQRDHESHRQKLTGHAASLQARLDSLDAAHAQDTTELRTQRDALTEQLDTLRQRYTDELQRYRDEQQRLRGRADALEELLAQRREEQRDQRIAFLDETQRLRTHTEHLRQRLFTLENVHAERCRELTAENRALAERVDELETALARTRRHNAELIERLTRELEQRAYASNRILALEASERRLLSGQAALQQALGEHASQARFLARRSNGLTNELNAMSSVVLGLELENQTLSAELKTTTDELVATGRLLDQSDRRTAEIDRELRHLRVRAGELQRETGHYRSSSERAADELASTREHLDRLQQTHERTLEESSELERRLERKARDDESEQRRLWAIIEKYRQEVEERQAIIDGIEASVSWRLTSPLRWVNHVVRSTPRFIGRSIYRSGRAVVHLLPERSRLRLALVQTYVRLREGLRGQIDNRALRRSHRRIIARRDEILGSKPPLAVDELPEITISIVTYNSAKWIRGFLESLARQDYPLQKISLLVVDNGSSDGTRETFAELTEELTGDDLSQFRLIRSRNVGFGAGHHKAIRKATSDFVLVTNVDLEFTPDCLVRAVSFAAQDADDVASWELRQQPYEHPKFYDPVTLETAWSSHACVLLRRSAYRKVGGYEKKIFMYGEDVELSYRFAAAGYRLRYLPHCQVLHHTYEEAGEVKPLQFQGSTLANAYLRLRYGSLTDVFAILPMYARLLAANTGVPNGRTLVRGNIAKLTRNAFYFLRKRRRRNRDFAFRHWDYDLSREGAFYVSPDTRERPLVSVITRTYQGRGALLRQSMQSVMHQTYPNVELVVVEDGGGTLLNVIEDIQRAYPERTIRYQPLEKVGRCVAGNEGLALTTGRYVMFLDDDDLLFCDHIATCVSELESQPELGAVYALSWEVETEFSPDPRGLYEELNHRTDDAIRQEFDREVIRHRNFIPIQSIVFKRELYERHGGFDLDLENLEDWNLWVRYSSEQDFKLIPKTTSMYRTPWDLSDKSRRQQSLDDYYAIARSKNQAALEGTSVVSKAS